MSSNILDVIAKASESVVSIETHGTQEGFFSEEVSPEMRGSGFVIDSDGHIVTNHHVVQNNKTVYITNRGNIIQGTVVNTSMAIDLALIKVDEELPVSQLGDSDHVKVGQPIYIIGNPMGIMGGPTVTYGIISGVQRSLKIKMGMQDLFLLDVIQTDASINPGNSGGTLIDVDGNVLGVPTAGLSFGQGIGFSIPVNMVKNYVEQVKTTGRYTIPWIGVDGVTITPHLNKHFKLGVDYGALVTDVVKDSPVDRAGLRRSLWLDLLAESEYPPKSFGTIVSFNDVKVEGFEELLEMIKKSPIGSMVKLGVLIKGRVREVNVEVGEIS